MIRLTLTTKAVRKLSQTYDPMSIRELWEDLLIIEASRNYKHYEEMTGMLLADTYKEVKELLSEN